MNSIFKSSLGFHIDLSKIVAISELRHEGDPRYSFFVDIQLMDNPKIITSYSNNKYFNSIEVFDKEVRQELIDAWIEYNKPKAYVSLDQLKGPDGKLPSFDNSSNGESLLCQKQLKK